MNAHFSAMMPMVENDAFCNHLFPRCTFRISEIFESSVHVSQLSIKIFFTRPLSFSFMNLKVNV